MALLLLLSGPWYDLRSIICSIILFNFEIDSVKTLVKDSSNSFFCLELKNFQLKIESRAFMRKKGG